MVVVAVVVVGRAVLSSAVDDPGVVTVGVSKTSIALRGSLPHAARAKKPAIEAPRTTTAVTRREQRRYARDTSA
jgi:hypothetical protein